MKVTILGCGGSLGVPLVGNGWGTVDPSDPRNRRRRPSLLVETATTTILVDTSPDCREQLLDARVQRLDAVLYTHSHADHIHGMDDIRPLIPHRQALPAFMDAETLRVLEHRFGYALDTVLMNRSIYWPFLTPRLIDGPFRVGDIDVAPFEQQHGAGGSQGFRFGADGQSCGYSTDVSALDERAFETLAGVDVWIVDACREAPHPSHAHLALALEWIGRVKPGRAYLTHMNHTMDYQRLSGLLPAGVAPAYDGLAITPSALDDFP